ncbi:MAG TPA: M48 family peptidase [Blastocatellia bacterium]|nr:M48 family peptidase [Blastocatellia bacterium]
MQDREQLQFDFDADEPEADLEAIFDEALRALVGREPRPAVEARFYPYAGLSSTIRLRQGRVYARISDILKHSPRDVLYALACILVAKLYRLKVAAEHERIYREYARQPSILNATDAARRTRGYKLTTSPRGQVYDLDELFDHLNARYFGGGLAKPQLSWSQQKTHRVLGHHDHLHGAIIISRTLDAPRIPRFVVEYVLYHEMLHAKHPPRRGSERTVYHSRQFRADELQFERYQEAVNWLDKLAAPVRRQRRARRRA